MSWVTINEELCDDCGFCVVRCACYSKQDGKIVAQSGIETCNLCGHCVSLCGTGAIDHSKMSMDNFKEVNPDANFNTETFIEFIRNRRSHRHLKNKEIPKEDLDLLVDTCRYAPTGGNMQTVELIVLRDKDKIQRLSDLTVDWFQMWGKAAEEEMKRQEEAGGDVDLALYRTARYGTNLSLARSIGRDPIFHKAPAVMIFHSVKRQGSNKDDCMIAATTMSLTARTMGIESTYIGLFESAARDNQEVFEELELPSTHGIYSVMIMGYPRLKYLRTVDRKPIRTQWL